jgi:hypothetical protein
MLTLHYRDIIKNDSIKHRPQIINMLSKIIVVTIILAVSAMSNSFTFTSTRVMLPLRSMKLMSQDPDSTSDPKESIAEIEAKAVNKGLTHIKYNKYAPSAEEAADMTDEQFRGVIFRRMVRIIES